MSNFPRIPGVSAPMIRALESAGYSSLDQLDGVDYGALAGLHGIGKRGLERLQAALEERGMSLANPEPVEPRPAPVVTAGATGKQAADIKTTPGGNGDEYVAGLDARRAGHAEILLGVFGRATGEEPVMWGPTMVGYGAVHYKYATGREGDTFRVGFSARKAKLSLYGLQQSPRWEELAVRLGKHQTSVACVYVAKPEDIYLGVLEEIVRSAWEAPANVC